MPARYAQQHACAVENTLISVSLRLNLIFKINARRKQSEKGNSKHFEINKTVNVGRGSFASCVT
jgi:hypothetical protein